MEKLGSPDPARPPPGAGPVAEDLVAMPAEVEENEASAVISSKLFNCACARRWIPLAYREELYHILRLTGPLLMSRILDLLLPFVITIFCGHIGNAELAGYALASAIINLTTTSTGYGLNVACNTLISQTYGSKNMKRVGVILQRSSLILMLFCMPCCGLLLNSQNILLLLQQEDEVARIAQIYVMVFLPAVPAMFLHQLQVSYLQNQGIILPQMYTAAAANVINLGVNYVLITHLQLGVIGSAIASSFSQITSCLLLYGYIRLKRLHEKTWGGWSTESLQEWDSYMKLAIPSVFMVCLEWWVWDIGGFFAGALGEEDLAARHILDEIGSIIYMFPLGVHVAACVRVGNALGAGNITRALVTCKVALVLAGTLAVLQGIVIAGCKTIIGYIFTSDDNIVAIVSHNITVYTFLQFFDAILCVCSGILVGCGMQKIAALSNLVGYYLIGLPVGVVLMFYAKLRVLGLWLGLLTCILFEVCLFLILIFRLDWKKVAQKAQKRAGKKVVVIPKRPVSTVLNEGIVPDISDCPVTNQSEGKEVSKAEGYSSVDTEDQELKANHASESNNTPAGGTEGDTEQSKSTKPQTLLSSTQLILRRGLALLVSVLFLVIGVAFHFAVPPPEPSVRSLNNFTLNWANDSTPAPSALLGLTTDLGAISDL
ncbi:multidrug and toxin extrusion protein 1-like [Notolabrus celidotus]|uniref:multidrug and toxin extrusion protein 1-like n=1 Tax=Notolabrus celidotus TaxID=1203425 RepID=UPI00148F7B91|nr:multidrug and toxin extrusion protein 1-like [Notolabrus celidotus]